METATLNNVFSAAKHKRSSPPAPVAGGLLTDMAIEGGRQ
jgi:hypothetical protein